MTIRTILGSRLSKGSFPTISRYVTRHFWRKLTYRIGLLNITQKGIQVATKFLSPQNIAQLDINVKDLVSSRAPPARLMRALTDAGIAIENIASARRGLSFRKRFAKFSIC